MKKLILLFCFLSFTSVIFAQVSKTVNLATAGTLSTSLTSSELATITNLTITGTMDARDFKTIRDDMPLIEALDLSGGTISAYNGTEGTSTSRNDYPADAIPDYAFLNSITRLGKIDLTTIVFPSSLSSIGIYAFTGCGRLTNVKIPSSVAIIGEHAFADCNDLTTVTIPSSVTSIEKYTFFHCSGLSNVKIPSSVTSIGACAFSFCSGLTTVTIPSSVTSIRDEAFTASNGLITVDSNNPNYSSLDGVLYNKSRTVLIHCPTSKIESFIIPSSVTSIGNAAFNGCRGLTTVTIPSSVASIGASAFVNCNGLTSIITSSITPIDLSESYGVFDSFKTSSTLYVPLGSKSAYQAAFRWKDFANIVEKDFTGIDPIISDQPLNVYPNPTTGKVKLVFKQIPQMGSTLTVNDFTGKTILTQFIQNKEEEVDLGGNSPGVYLIRTNMKDFKIQKVILK
ncbi:MAG TPA: leucine-rich repeat protein [Prolixibacteraceae bacterium]|nr:leucine-rich repeat protein [Prolixibacteraceae bacterium]